MKRRIREANVSNIPELKSLFKETIISVNSKDYSKEEVFDWASCGDDDNRWRKLVTELYFIIAINESSKIIGFASISKEGYLHSMFVHKYFQKQGVASLLYNTIEDYAKQNNLPEITSEVSITAKPFFEKQGFTVDEQQKRKANKMMLTNFRMSKQLKS